MSRSTLLIGGCGYIGSALYCTLAEDYDVSVWDTEVRGNPGHIPHLENDFTEGWGYIQEADDIILLAAHSSVATAEADPFNAFWNNIVGFYDVLRGLRSDQRLIYASTSSIYSGFGSDLVSEDGPRGNMYDFTKYADDCLAMMSDKNVWGLRFGTVNGPSPNTRWDLMLNKMCKDAEETGLVTITSPEVHRPILGINDLCRAVQAILNGTGRPGIYNLASFNSSVLTLGRAVSRDFGCPLQFGPNSPTYDFAISSRKFQKEYSFTFQETAGSIIQELREVL